MSGDSASYKQNFIKINDIKLCYYDNEVTQSDGTMVLLSPGTCDAQFYIENFTLLGLNMRVIVPDYPGRGDSLPIKDNSVQSMAQYIIELPKILGLQNIVLLGISYGTAVANEMVRIDQNPFQKVILIAGGEFLTKIEKIILKIVFFPPKYSEKIRRFYRFLLMLFFPYFDNLPRCHLRSVLAQLLNILDYRIKYDKEINIPTILLDLNQDKVVRKDSLHLLQKMYKNIKIHKLDLGHTGIFNDPEKKTLLLSWIEKSLKE